MTSPMLYRVALTFTGHDSPAAIGEWREEDPAHRTYRSWVGRYGGPAVTIRFTAHADGEVTELKRWPPPPDKGKPSQ